jgi:hypothetical protein
MLFDIAMKGYDIVIGKPIDNEKSIHVSIIKGAWEENPYEDWYDFYAETKAELEAQLNDFLLSL